MAKKRSQRHRKLSEEERAERRAAERELMASAIEELRSSEGWQRWLRVRHRFHSYSLHNQLLIALQRPSATRVTGFRRWLDLGYAVRKGEHGIRIWAPCPPSNRKLREWEAAGSDPEERPRTFFRLVSVFDRSQVEPLAEFPGGPVELDPPIAPVEGDGLAHLQEPLIEFAASLGYRVLVKNIPGRALGYCSPGGRVIGVEPVGGEFSANAQVATLIHENAHALVRHDRQKKDPILRYAEEEVVVECVAYTVCSSVGLDTAGNSIPYMTSWSEGGEIERYASLIDRLATRLEAAACGDSGTPGAQGEEARLAA
jgi:antirestriction protein ArdC